MASKDFFFGGGDAPATKRLSRDSRRGSGPRQLPDATEVKILKRFIVLEHESINIYLALKSIFLRKISKFEHILQKFLNFFEKLFYNFQVLWGDPINSENFPVNSIMYLRNLSKKLKVA